MLDSVWKRVMPYVGEKTLSCVNRLKANGPPPWAFVGRALMGPPAALVGWVLTGALGPHGPGPNGPPWALMAWALTDPLWVLIGKAQMGALGPPRPGPNGPSWALT